MAKLDSYEERYNGLVEQYGLTEDEMAFVPSIDKRCFVPCEKTRCTCYPQYELDKASNIRFWSLVAKENEKFAWIEWMEVETMIRNKAFNNKKKEENV